MNDSNIAIDTSTCLACGNCVDRCIMDNLRLTLPPCRQASPLGINYQGIARLIASGKEEEAAKELRRATPFGGIVAALGDASAEKSCSRSHFGGALRFTDLLRYLVSVQSGIVYGEAAGRLPRSSKKVAVIGAGPAGLQAAWSLRMGGHAVTVFEAAPEVGLSLIRPYTENGEDSAAPAVSPEIMKKTVTMLEKSGITFATSTPKGQADLDSLCREYDAVICTCGKGAVLPADKNGWVKENLFAAGTCVKNQKSMTPLQAMASALKASHAARNLLEGFDIDYESDERTARGLERFAGLQNDEDIAENSPVTPAGDIFTPEEAHGEAARCLGCGRPYERNKTCWYCLPCEVVCPTQALHVRIPYLIR